MKKFSKFYLAPLLALVLMLTSAMPAFAATLDGKDDFFSRDLGITVDGGTDYYELEARVVSGTRTPLVDLRVAAKKFGYQVEFITAGQDYWSPAQQTWSRFGNDAYVLLENTSWDEDRTNLRSNLTSRDLTLRSVRIWDAYRNSWYWLSVYEVKSLSRGAGFLASVYDLPTLFPAKVAKVERSGNGYYDFNLTTTAAANNTATVRTRYNIKASVDRTDWRNWGAIELQNDATTWLEAREIARSLGIAVEYRKAGRYYTDPATGNSVYLHYDTYVFLTSPGWSNSGSNMLSDVRDRSSFTARQVQVWFPYENIWAWIRVKEVNDTSNGGGFLFNLFDLPSFYPGSKVEQANGYPGYFYITTKAVTPPPADIPDPIIDPNQTQTVDPNDIHGPTPPPVTDFIPANGEPIPKSGTVAPK